MDRENIRKIAKVLRNNLHHSLGATLEKALLLTISDVITLTIEKRSEQEANISIAEGGKESNHFKVLNLNLLLQLF